MIAAGAGQLPASVVGERFSLADTVASAALRTRTTLRLEVDLNRARFDQHGLGRLGVSARAGLVVPLVFHNQSYGVLIVLDGLEGEPGFTTEDERLLEAFAASAATAQAAASKLHRERVIAAENERGRWARALHDETLQALAGARLGLATARRRRDAKTLDEAVIQVIGDLDDGIANLRSLVADLRPVALDELGLEAAVEALCARACRDGLEIDRSIELASTPGGEPTRHTSELETALYRIIQEALTNATKHGQAKRAVVEISETRTTVELSVRDDGTGFDPLTSTAGFGLLGMRERVALLRGSARIESAPGDGTRVTARFPVYRRAARTLAGPPDEPLRAGTA